MEMVLVIVVGAVVGIGIVAWAAMEIAQQLNRGRTTREIMAYVAEGTITPEDAASLIELSERAELRRKVLKTADWDTDWERWRDTVRELFSDDLGSTKPERPADQAATA